MKTIDIIVPCYNEHEVLTTFYAETKKVVKEIPDCDFRFLFINDGSRDDTLVILKGLAVDNPDVKYISFSRNFGKEAGMYAGLENSTADYVIIMDADLQHPPALIPRMIESVDAGHDCCAAYRTTRAGEKKITSFFSQTFYKINNRLTDVKLPYGAVDFRIMSRKMVDTIVSMPERQRFSKGIFSWVGFDVEWIPYENVERTMGQTKWSFKSLTRYAMDGIFSFSVRPLKTVAVMGFVISGIAICYAIYVLVKTLVWGIDYPGYASTLIIMLLLGGIIEISIGIVGEYIARIYNEIKHRPIYITKESNLSNSDEVNNDEKLS